MSREIVVAEAPGPWEVPDSLSAAHEPWPAVLCRIMGWDGWTGRTGGGGFNDPRRHR